MGDREDIYHEAVEVERMEERRRKNLVKVRLTFFYEIREEMRRCERQVEEHPREVTPSERIRLLDRRRKLEGVLKNLIHHRTRKIFNDMLFALLYEKGEFSSAGGYTEEELWLVERLERLLKDYIALVRDGSMPEEGSPPEVEEEELPATTPPEPGVEEPAPEPEEEEVEEGEEEVEDANVVEEDVVLIRVLDDVGPIAMHDGTSCHLRKEDVLHLPRIYAMPLVKMGVAEEVPTPFMRKM